VAHRVLSAQEARRVEPGLNPEAQLAGAVHLPDDGFGNCRLFAQLLKGHAQRLGVNFEFETTVLRMVPGKKPQLVLSRAGKQDSREFDAVVVCAGARAGELLRPAGLPLPLASVWGYSITAPLRHFEAHPEAGPQAALMDERFKVAITRLGQRVRVAGSAEIGGRPEHFHAGAMATLYRVLNDWFPGVPQLAQAQRWKGARPMLPDGPPLVGASGLAGIWLNLGHGSSGWALACGSAQVLTEQMAGRDAGLDTRLFQVARLRSRA
jgi:D-amino-acid dehydrogenase